MVQMTKTELRLAVFGRGRDSHVLEVYMKMKTDYKRLWMVCDFKGNQQAIRRYLKEFVKAGLVEELKSYPKLYRLVIK